MTMIKPATVTRGDDATRQIERLTLEVANLRSENRGLRRRLPASTGDMKRLRQAHRDARAMMLHRFDGYSISRLNCLALGIAERRWTNARALLQVARIHDGYDVTETDFDTALGALDEAFRSMESAGDCEVLRLYLPMSRAWAR